MGQVGELIASMAGRRSGLASGLLEGIDPATAARFPKNDGDCINCNHPVFVLGHLATYPHRMMQVLGQEVGDAAVPQQYEELFAAGVDCRDDASGSIYPSLDEVNDHFTRAYGTVISAIKNTEDAVFFQPIEGNERAKEFFGTVGPMINFMIRDHYMFHLGQVSTWRRAMGLASAF